MTKYTQQRQQRNNSQSEWTDNVEWMQDSLQPENTVSQRSHYDAKNTTLVLQCRKKIYRNGMKRLSQMVPAAARYAAE